jgi:putative inorganic carbon (hco3(-)) transporter
MINRQNVDWQRNISIFFGIICVLTGVALGNMIPQTSSISLIFVITLGIVGAFVILINLEVGLYALIFMAYLRVSDIAVQFYGAPSILQPFFLLILVAIVINWIRFGMPQSKWTNAVVAVVAYGLVVTLSLIYATDFKVAYTVVTDFVKNGIIAVFLAIMIQRGVTFKRVLWVLLLAGIFVSTISVYQYLTKQFTNPFWGFGQADYLNIVTGVDDYRIAGPIGDPNYYAQIIVILIPIAFEFLLTEKKWFARIIAFLALLVCSLTIIFTFSRGGFFAFAVVIACLILYHKLHPIYIILTLLFLILIFFFLPNNYTSRLGTITDVLSGQMDVRDEASLSGRLSEFIAAGQMFADHPIFGVGVGNYPAYYDQYAVIIGLDINSGPHQPHNLFLEIAAETGILGLTVFLGILYYMYQTIIDSWKKLRKLQETIYSRLVVAFGISLIGYFSAAIFIHGAYPRYIWLLVGIAFSLPQVTKDILDHARQNER